MKQLASLELDPGDDAVHAVVRGELDLSNVHDIELTLREALVNTTFGLSIDLSDVQYIDSVGIEFLLRLSVDLARRQQRLALVVPPGAVVARALEVSGVGPDVEQFATTEAARAAASTDAR